MTSVLVAVPEARARGLADELEMEGITVVSVVPPNRVLPLPEGVDAAIVVATRAVLTSELVAECDRAGVRIIPLGDSDSRLLGRYGLTTALPADANGWEVAAALTADIPRITGHEASPPHRVTVVWGPSGAPGLSLIHI